MYVKNNMTTNPYTIAPEATITDAMELMVSKKVKHLPVVKNSKLVGIVTNRDILHVSPSPATSLSIFEVNYYLSKTKIDSIMTKKPITVTPDTLVEEVSLLMRDHEIEGLPVLDGDKLVGIITETDVFDAFIEIMGFRDRGVRIALEVSNDKPGILAEVAGVIAAFDVNITHLAVFRNELIVRINTNNVSTILKELEEKGYKIISLSENA